MAITHRPIRSTRLLVFGLLLASLVTITVDARGGERGPLAVIGRGLGAVVGPLQEGVAAIFRPIGSFVTNVFRAGELADQNAALQSLIAELQSQLQDTLGQRREIDVLKGILDLAADEGLQVEGAEVIGESPGNFEWAVDIDKGSADGIETNMPVVSDQGLVGRVVQVYPFTSKVMLIIDPDSTVSARLSHSGERGAVVGQRDEPLRFDLVDPEVEVQPGEIVETSAYQLDEGLEGLFPSGIGIGVVERVEPDEAGITLQVDIRPNVDFTSLAIVAVVTGTSPLTSEDTGSNPSPTPDASATASP
jgi:rod shape-determining protein MreC